MKISGYDNEVSEDIYENFIKFSDTLKTKTFRYEDFVNYINQNSDFLFAYKWHLDEEKLKSQYPHKDIVCIYNVIRAFSGENKLFFKDSDGKKKIIVKKLDKNLFELI